MAEYFVGPVIEKLIDACFEYLKVQVRWQTGMKEELEMLRDIHPQIQAVVSAYNQVDIKDPALNKWLWKLRDAVDEADDVLDEFDYWKREKQASKNKKIRKVRSLMKSLKKSFVKIVKRALKIDSNLKRLEVAVQNLYKISAEVNTLRHLLKDAKQTQQQQQLELHKIRETGSMPTNGLLGRSKEMEFIRQWLRNPYETQIIDTSDLYRKISVLSVVGHGGMGKTTLLQHVYKDGMTEGFDVKMWVCVSDNFDSKTVIINILKSLGKQVSNEEPLEAVQRSLQSEVMSKRFLLALDDIWEDDETKWEKVLAPLQYGSLGSKILITTRMDSIASMFANMIKKSKKMLQLEGLEEEKVLQLFNTHAFAGVENPDDEFRSIAGKIVEKLSGSPLAAKIIGGILNSYVDKSYWIKVLNTNIRSVGSGQNHLLPILKLSYIYLPKFLQNCFTFCCIFPQDYEFDKDDLVRMWISLGFIHASDIQGESLEDTGRRYFNILVQKSLFDKFHTYEDKVCYKMHDLLHELAQSVSTQECFKVDENEFTIPPDTIRHLSINTRSSSLKATFQKMGKFKNLRSLFLYFYKSLDYDEHVIFEIVKALKSVRLLVIYSPFTFNMPKTIGSLIHLRYLKFECFLGLKLRRSISHLYHLQFIISNKLRNLEMNELVIKELIPSENCQLIVNEVILKDPSVLLMEPLRSICSFRSLEIVYNDVLVSFPSETEQWFLQHRSSLFRLKFYQLQSLQSLPFSLESLSSLETLEICDLESLQCLPSSLLTISSLTRLTLENIPLLKSLPDLPYSLKELKIIELQSLQCLSSSFSAISSLTHLKLKNLPLLKSLPDLPPFLKKLKLESSQCLPSSLSAISSLETLKLKNIPLLKSLPDLPSSLTKLELKELESLQCLPSSLSTFSSLWRVKLRNIPLLKSLSDLPSSIKELSLEKIEFLPVSLSTFSSLRYLELRNIPLLKSLPDLLPPSLKELYLEKLENLDCLPACLPTLKKLEIIKVPQLLELPDLPASLKELELRELESFQCLPSCLPTQLKLWIIKVPRLLELPDLLASLEVLYIEDCHPHLMERYENFIRLKRMS